jgi:hypothetical protein
MADTKIVVNCETGEVAEIQLTQAELDQREADRLAFEAQKAEEEAAKQEAAEAKAALLAKLGISEDEAKLLLS